MYLLIVVLYCHVRDVMRGGSAYRTDQSPHRLCRHQDFPPRKMKFNDGASSFIYLNSIAVVFQKILLEFH